MNLVDELHAVAAALTNSGIGYALCGGVAVTIHGAPRTTKDIDVLVAADDVPRALAAVAPLGFSYVALPMTFDAGTPRERHVRRVSKLEGDEHLILDLIVEDASLAGTLADRIEIDLPTGRLAVVSRATLLRMKELAGRPQDLADVEALKGADGP
jgi:hypothetical protein